MSTSDNYANIAGDFSNYLKGFFEPAPNHTTFHFGYKPVIDLIEAMPDFPNIKLIDYGCGSGQFSAFLRTKGVSTKGVDASETMLETAKKNFPDMEDSFSHADTIHQLTDNGFDVCTMNFIISEIQTENELEEIFSNVAGLLKSSGSVIILTNNPEAQPEGAQFNSWSVGPVETDKPGSSFKITIHDEGSYFELTDYFWSKDLVTAKLKKSGFVDIKTLTPSLENVSNKSGWKDEEKIPPMLIYQAYRP